MSDNGYIGFLIGDRAEQPSVKPGCIKLTFPPIEKVVEDDLVEFEMKMPDSLTSRTRIIAIEMHIAEITVKNCLHHGRIFQHQHLFEWNRRVDN